MPCVFSWRDSHLRSLPVYPETFEVYDYMCSYALLWFSISPSSLRDIPQHTEEEVQCVICAVWKSYSAQLSCSEFDEKLWGKKKKDQWFRKRGQRSPHKSPYYGKRLPRSRCVFGTWHRIALPDQKNRPNPQTINMSFLNPKTEATAAQQASLPLALPHSLCFNTSLSRLPSCPTHWILIPACHVFFSLFFSTSPLLHQTLAAYLVITRRLRKPFHLRDWQLSQWNTIKWLPLKRKGKFELWYATACRTALLLKWGQRWRSCRRCIFFVFFPPFISFCSDIW